MRKKDKKIYRILIVASMIVLLHGYLTKSVEDLYIFIMGLLLGHAIINWKDANPED
jgi:hypothetical protein